MEIITVDHPKAAVLRRRARPVGRVTGDIQRLADAMVEAMREANGVGLAAPQVGVSLRVFVAEVEERLHVLVDPEIVEMEGEEFDTEGCLSIPGIVAEVPRAERIVVKGKNRRGRGITVAADGLLARVFQHEIDHLDGVLFLDRVVDRSTIREVAATTEVEPASPPDHAGSAADDAPSRSRGEEAAGPPGDAAAPRDSAARSSAPAGRAADASPPARSEVERATPTG